eukprot:GFUD01013316.1.p1 GENE.GFUD01013316.1~~GFUD01013316.1.p1  ORF type:complete len:180 (+),score=35.19 GFUD01013316.1:248-787(+)
MQEIRRFQSSNFHGHGCDQPQGPARVRNLIAREEDQLKAFKTQDATNIVQKNTSKSWTFDRVYSQLDNKRTVYINTDVDIIESNVSGFNTTIFEYGQTSSGKTHTMHGSQEETGVVGMAVEQLFYAVELDSQPELDVAWASYPEQAAYQLQDCHHLYHHASCHVGGADEHYFVVYDEVD